MRRNLIVNILVLLDIVNHNNNNNNHHQTLRPGYDADGDNSDSNSLPSVNSDKDSHVRHLIKSKSFYLCDIDNSKGTIIVILSTQSIIT